MSKSDGTYVKPRFGLVYLDDISAKTPQGIELEKNECRNSIASIRERLAMLIASSPKDLMSQYDLEESDPQTWITERIDEIDEELQEQYSKYERLSILENLLDEWENGSYCNYPEWMNIMPDIDFGKRDKINLAFQEDNHLNESYHYDILMGKAKLDEHSLDEMYASCSKNLLAENYVRNEMTSKVFAKIDDKLFVTYTGQWLFTNEEEAFKAIMAKLNIPKTDYINVKFIDEHKDFFENLMNWVSDDDKEVIQLYIGKEDEQSLNGNYGLMTEFYNRVSEGIDNYVKSKVKFYKLDDILENL